MVCERELTAPAWCMVVGLEGLTYRAEAVVAEPAATWPYALTPGISCGDRAISSVDTLGPVSQSRWNVRRLKRGRLRCLRPTGVAVWRRSPPHRPPRYGARDVDSPVRSGQTSRVQFFRQGG